MAGFGAMSRSSVSQADAGWLKSPQTRYLQSRSWRRPSRRFEACLPIAEISRLVGHSSTSVTETVYRHQLRPVIQRGAEAMDELFGTPKRDSLDA